MHIGTSTDARFCNTIWKTLCSRNRIQGTHFKFFFFFKEVIIWLYFTPNIPKQCPLKPMVAFHWLQRQVVLEQVLKAVKYLYRYKTSTGIKLWWLTLFSWIGEISRTSVTKTPQKKWYDITFIYHFFSHLEELQSRLSKAACRWTILWRMSGNVEINYAIVKWGLIG